MLYWLGVLLATIGAALILGALTFVSALIGGVVNAMILLMAGPVVDKFVARRGGAPPKR
jgi:hypothetical protein